MPLSAKILLTVLAIIALMAPSAALADETAAPTVTWAGSVKAEVGVRTTLKGTVDAPEAPAFTVIVERDQGTAWAEIARFTTATFSVPVNVAAGVQRLRARLVVADQDVAEATATVTGVRARVTATLSMPSHAKDYQRINVTAATRRTHDRRPVTVRAALQFRENGTTRWSTARSFSVTSGKRTIGLTPRKDGRYRLVTAQTESLLSRTSASRKFDNRPPGKPVVLPKGASRPTVRLPAQPRAKRIAADAKVSKISGSMWSSMKGRSWHQGCPVGRSQLRVVRVSYWAFDGYLRRGEIVVAASVANRTKRIFTDLFNAKVPIRSMYRVDRFGYKASLKGADDILSMRADNTSAFNCRRVVGSPGQTSPHTYGRSIDINPWENPFRSARGYTPNASWQKRSNPTNITWRGKKDKVVKIFARHGFRWLGSADLHHFQRS